VSCDQFASWTPALTLGATRPEGFDEHKRCRQSAETGEGEMIVDEAIARLAKLDTCAVSDALDRMGLKGAVLGIGPLWPCPRIVGRYITVKIKPAGLEKSKQHLCTSAIAAATPGDVIVVDNGGRVDVAAWGGLLSLAAQVRQVRGVIVDGACRDLDESRELGFPVFGRAAVQVTARGRIIQQSFNEEIAFAGVQVHPGDLVIADASGAVFVLARPGAGRHRAGGGARAAGSRHGRCHSRRPLGGRGHGDDGL
jgi:4-hydroxy-4-methyl-2-oxoglutarate aldolase